MSRYKIREEQWEKIKGYFCERRSKRGKPGKSDQKTLNALLWIARSGAACRDLPERYAPWKTVYSRFTKWRDEGIFEKIFLKNNSHLDLVRILGIITFSGKSILSSQACLPILMFLSSYFKKIAFCICFLCICNPSRF